MEKNNEDTQQGRGDITIQRNKKVITKFIENGIF